MQEKIIKELSEIVGIKDGWISFQEEIEDTCFYDTYEYYCAWIESNQERFSPYVICIYEANSLIGLAPLVRHLHPRKGIFGKQNTTLGFIEKGDFHNFLVRKGTSRYGIIKKLFGIIEDNSMDWDRLLLERVNPLGVLGNYIQSNDTYINYFSHRFVCPYIDISKERKSEYFQTFPRRKSIKQYSRSLKKHTNYHLEEQCGGGENLLKRISEIHVKEKDYLVTEKHRSERVSHFEVDEKYFIEKLYLDGKNIRTFFLVSEEGETIAYVTCYDYNKTLNLWNMAYNPLFQKYSPTCALLYELTLYLFENEQFEGFRLDLGSGSYAWKHQFTDTAIYNFSLNYLRPGCKNYRFWNFVYLVWEMRSLIKRWKK